MKTIEDVMWDIQYATIMLYDHPALDEYLLESPDLCLERKYPTNNRINFIYSIINEAVKKTASYRGV